MLYLLLSVILTSLLFMGFKWYDRKGEDLLTVISGNYVSCIVTGLLLNGPSDLTPYPLPLSLCCFALGVLFFIVFYGMGFASAKIGIGITGASTKMSLVIPVIFSALYFKEPIDAGNIAAILLALTAVILLSSGEKKQIASGYIMLPILIFLGSGIVDTSLNILQATVNQTSREHEMAIVYIFSAAFVTSLFAIFSRTMKIRIRSFLAGFLLGIPNYFSVYFMLKALGSELFPRNEFFVVNNTAVLLVTFLLGILVFREPVSLRKGIGLFLSIASILLLMF